MPLPAAAYIAPKAASLAPSLISAGASILGGAFGGKGQSIAKMKRDYRIGRQQEDKYGGIGQRVRQAKEAGLHPLFALGANLGSSPSFSTAGQSARGSAAQQGLEGVARAAGSYGRNQTQLDLVHAQNQSSALRLAEHALSNDTSQSLVETTLPKIESPTQEIKKGEVDTHMKKQPEQSTSVMSPYKRVRLGSQEVWVPTDEVDTFMEDPLAVGSLTYLYHGNKNVDWALLVNEFRGRKLTPGETSQGTKEMFKRLKKRKLTGRAAWLAGKRK